VSDEVTTVRSNHGVAETIDRLVAGATAAGLRIVARVDHAASAREVGLDLRPTELVLFGHPAGGTPLMQDRQESGIDLPLRALAREDEGGQVFLDYVDPAWIASQHGLGEASASAVAALASRLATLASAACT
jgi:uncharacterized protein (DUF302 family)